MVTYITVAEVVDIANAIYARMKKTRRCSAWWQNQDRICHCESCRALDAAKALAEINGALSE